MLIILVPNNNLEKTGTTDRFISTSQSRTLAGFSSGLWMYLINRSVLQRVSC